MNCKGQPHTILVIVYVDVYVCKLLLLACTNVGKIYNSQLILASTPSYSKLLMENCYNIISQMARVIALMVIDLIARHNYIKHKKFNGSMHIYGFQRNWYPEF